MEQSQKHFSVLEKEHNHVSTVLNINHIITFLHTVQILTIECCYFSESKVCSKCDKSSKNIDGTSQTGTSLEQKAAHLLYLHGRLFPLYE